MCWPTVHWAKESPSLSLVLYLRDPDSQIDSPSTFTWSSSYLYSLDRTMRRFRLDARATALPGSETPGEASHGTKYDDPGVHS
ncbi:hypothetical protein VFPFJ_02692 [Purpureocillium lilacinum]|uniref:Uncharacterized protein n=1 Tax=Purpureocillium lilacinum TaxID=33203 RepID=A0A179HVW5_PURLI|nr:hypothetical protein VFPFJ_02692 [Purpureocillium lilacinum]OAQ78726.1 hypothetical protein VFPBJ_06847 [Purpureocillium lilacinum]OAQ93530.1 hypothetical protein VFPFJ_02692 [Purpureocillium lilacinum]